MKITSFLKKHPGICSIEEFSIFYLNFIRNNTEQHLKSNAPTSVCNTPKKIIPDGSQLNTELNEVQLEIVDTPSQLTKSNSTTSRPQNSSYLATRKPQQESKSVTTTTATSEATSTKTIIATTISVIPSEDKTLFGNDRKNYSRSSISSNRLEDNSKSLDSSSQFDDSLQLRYTSVASTPVKNDSVFLKNSSRTSDSASTLHESFTHLSCDESFGYSDTPSKSFEHRPLNSSTSTPIRKQNRLQQRDMSGGCVVSGLGETGNVVSSPSNCGASGLFSDSFNKTKSCEKSNSSNYRKSPVPSLCLGDFIVSSASKTKRRIGYNNNNGSSFQQNDNRKLSDSPIGNKNSRISAGNEIIKPKRRVAPTAISSTVSNFTSPAFCNENNFLEIAKEVKPERQVLKTEISAIAKELELEDNAYPLKQKNFGIIAHQEKNLSNSIKTRNTEMKIDLTNVTSRPVLDRFIEIHSAIIDLNLTTNILHEISYVVNLFSMEFEESDTISELVPSKLQPQILDATNKDDDDNGGGGNTEPIVINVIDNVSCTSVLKNYNNCVYFALGVLQKQKSLLALFDLRTLKVILENDRLNKLDKKFKEFLSNVYTHKVGLEATKTGHEASFRVGQNFNNVFFQQENDSRNNFPSDKEFAAFKKQRDLFCKILKIWEAKHLTPSWSFSSELTCKVHNLLSQTNHPITMAHLSKLLTSQLILSCNFNENPTDLEIALPNIDLSKLSKLEQRFVAPSNFSTDYQFPGNQAFFRDFFNAASYSALFTEQLKIALGSELLEMNDSSFEIVNLSSDESREYAEYVVRPETIATMRVLAKFLGLVISRPFHYDGARHIGADSKQTQLRNMFHPVFDVMEILKKSISDRKLIITLPWLVQYISMLDCTTLRLKYYRRLFQMLYEIYMNLTYNNARDFLQMRPTSIFIIRSCLGWLFEQPNIPEDYYQYRQNRQFPYDVHSRDLKLVLDSIPISMPSSLSSLSGRLNFNEQILLTRADKSSSSSSSSSSPTSNDKLVLESKNSDNQTQLLERIEISTILKTFDPLLENILIVACPFLADFRVSIMPTKMSRTGGRYLQQTTKVAEATSASINHESDSQAKLSEAFLHSQSLSVRRTIEFVIERTTSAVVKDYQIEILIPSKEEALEKVRKIDCSDAKRIIHEMYDIYTEAHKSAMIKWDREVPKMIQTRAKKALDALLPVETFDSVKKTCVGLIVTKCISKTSDWRISNLSGIDFYSKDLPGDADKLVKKKFVEGKSIARRTSLEIVISEIPPSDVFTTLQCMLHYTTYRQDLFNVDELHTFCENYWFCTHYQKLPSSMYKTGAVMLVHLAQNIIKNFSHILTDNLIQKFIKIWSCDELKEFMDVPVESTEIKCPTRNEVAKKKADDAYILQGLINNLFIKSLGNNVASFESLTRLLVALVNEKLLTIDFLNEQFVALFKIDWPQDVLKLVSNTLRLVAKCTSNNTDDEQPILFMEMLSDFARDLEEF